jgi:hypothetical protein
MAASVTVSQGTAGPGRTPAARQVWRSLIVQQRDCQSGGWISE